MMACNGCNELIMQRNGENGRIIPKNRMMVKFLPLASALFLG